MLLVLEIPCTRDRLVIPVDSASSFVHESRMSSSSVRNVLPSRPRSPNAAETIHEATVPGAAGAGSWKSAFKDGSSITW